MKLLIFSDWYEPGYLAGGPIRSLQNLAKSLSSDAQIDVFTSNKDFSSEKPYDLPADQWVDRSGTHVWYCSDSGYNSSVIKSILKEGNYDKIYFNSLFSYKYTLRPMFLAKRNGYAADQLVLAPRGMLGKGALQLKRNEKNLFIRLTNWIGLFKDITWHATTEEEAERIKENYTGAKTMVAPNFPDPKLTDDSKQLSEGKKKLVFLSRISPIKNLKFVLECVSRYSEQDLFRFDLYGTPEDESYLNEILALAKEKDIDLEYHGTVSHDQVAETLRKGDFLVLPTLNENYGHIIFESLASGTPVIISDQTPWRNLRAANVGWDIPLDPPSWKQALEEVSSLQNDQYAVMSAKCIDYARDHLSKIDLSPYFRLFQMEKS